MPLPPDLTPLPAWLDCDERTARRCALQLLVTVKSDATGELVGVITDVSSGGCRIDMKPAATLGRYLTIQIKGLPTVEGWVAWKRGNEHGVDFAQPLLLELVERLTTES